jgi:hypothetical protein
MRFPGLVAVAWLAVAGALSGALVAPAHAEKRVAVVVGNDRYPNLSIHEQLQKAVSDARAVGSVLRRIGFDVISGENLGRQALIDRLDDAVRRITPGDTVFFFFPAMASRWTAPTTSCPPTCPSSPPGRSRG